jgi:hypothetical protein
VIMNEFGDSAVRANPALLRPGLIN